MLSYCQILLTGTYNEPPDCSGDMEVIISCPFVHPIAFPHQRERRTRAQRKKLAMPSMYGEGWKWLLSETVITASVQDNRGSKAKKHCTCSSKSTDCSTIRLIQKPTGLIVSQICECTEKRTTFLLPRKLTKHD